MVLADADIEEYIDLDLEEGQHIEEEKQSSFMKKILASKVAFKQEMCTTVSILKLGYMFKVLQQVYGQKATLLPAEAFEYKVKKVEKELNKDKDNMRRTMQGTGVSKLFSEGGGNQSMDLDSKALGSAELQELQDPLLQ